jgi:GNAT superfamily N-acetyltransferase
MNATLRVLRAEARHYDDFVRLSAQLGSHDPVPPRERWLAEMAGDSFFLELDGRVAAYGYGHVLERSGYVRHVVVDREFRGRGLGRALMREHARRFRAAGCENWQLNVLRDNAVAIGLYRSLGMEIDYATWVVRIAPSDVANLPSSPRATELRTLAAHDDSQVEKAFDLTPGLLATFRGRHGQRIVELVDAVAPDRGSLAVARFDPAYPGCFPFRVADPSFARAFITPMLTALASDAPWIQFAIERDEPLARTLLAAGATLQHDIVHMRGALP